MSVKIEINYWKPTPVEPTDVPGYPGSKVVLGEVRTDAGDADLLGDDLVLILDIDPDASDPDRPFNGMRITGTIAEIEQLIAYLQEGVDLNRAHLMEGAKQ